MSASEINQRLEVVLRVGPDGPFLIGGECGDCGEIVFPKPQICPQCTGQKITEVPLSRQGTLYTYAEVSQKPPDYCGPTPYMVGRVLLPEGVFVLTQIDANQADLNINMPLELVVKPIYRDECGNDVIGYMFRPVRNDQ